jgi:hypothetical protein
VFFSVIKRGWPLIVFLLLVTVIAFQSIQDQHRRDFVLRIMRIHAGSDLREWSTILNEKLKPVTAEGFTSLDFSLPGDEGFGDDSDPEFFNPSGRFKARQLSQDHLAIKPIFNVRRHLTKIANSTSMNLKESVGLYAIIPLDIKCSGSDESIVVAPDNHVIITDTRTIHGCQRSSDGQAYYFFPLIWSERFIKE